MLNVNTNWNFNIYEQEIKKSFSVKIAIKCLSTSRTGFLIALPVSISFQFDKHRCQICVLLFPLCHSCWEPAISHEQGTNTDIYKGVVEVWRDFKSSKVCSPKFINTTVISS